MKRLYWILFLYFSVSLLNVLAQVNSTKPSAETSPYVKESVALPETIKPTPRRDPDKVIVCLVNDRRLTQAGVDRMLSVLLADKKGTEEHQEQIRFVYTQNIITEWLERNLLAEEAEAEGILVSEEDLTLQEEELIKASGITFEIDNALSRLGQSKEEYRQQLRDAMFGERLVRKRMRAFYSEKELRKVYSSNPEAFQRPPRVRVFHILHPLKGDESSIDKKTIKEWMEEARKKMRRGIDPSEIIEREDLSRGVIARELGWLYPNNLMPEPINYLVFKLKVGDVSEVVETKYGFYIIRVEEKQPAYGGNFEEAREAVINSVFEEVRQKVLLSAKYKHKIRINMGGVPEDKM